MEDRKRRFDDGDVVEKIHEVLKKTVGTGGGLFDGVHVFTPHADVPDDSGLRLVVLSPAHWYCREEPRQAAGAVLDHVKNNGGRPRYRGNRLVFLAADQGVLSRLRDTARVALAWQSIVDDVETGRLNIDVLQQNQAKKELQTSLEVLPRAARECYKWLLCPVQQSATDPAIDVEAFPLTTTAGTIGGELARVCAENELVISAWSPVHLRSLLQQFYWRDGKTAAEVRTFWDDSQKYLYLPRLKSRDVLTAAIREGAKTRDYFATAHGRTGETYEGFAFGDPHVQADADSLLLIEPAAAAAFAKAREATKPTASVTGSGPTPLPPVAPIPPAGSGTTTPAPPAAAAVSVRRFHGTAAIDASTAKMRLRDIADEIIALLASDPDATVSVTLDISAEFPNGAKDHVKRGVSENATNLGFTTKSWE